MNTIQTYLDFCLPYMYDLAIDAMSKVAIDMAKYGCKVEVNRHGSVLMFEIKTSVDNSAYVIGIGFTNDTGGFSKTPAYQLNTTLRTI